MRITLIGPNGIALMHAHATSCRDIGQPRYRSCEKEVLECASVQEVVEDWFSDFLGEAGRAETWEDFLGEIKFFPCCSGLPRTNELGVS